MSRWESGENLWCQCGTVTSERSADRRLCGLRFFLGVALSKFKMHLKKSRGPQERRSALRAQTRRRYERWKQVTRPRLPFIRGGTTQAYSG
jgi:hypothetical protein